MKLLMKGRVFVAVLAATCLMVVLLTVVPTRSGTSTPGPGQYDPWLDWNDDGKINLIDLFRVALSYGTSGHNISKAGLAYDSGWINITDKAGQNITVTHNLNITDWNDPNIIVDITGRTTLTSQLLRSLGLTGHIQGWSKTYGGTSDDFASALVQTSDGGYAMAGYTASFGAGNLDVWLVKTDSTGNVLWRKTYGGANTDSAYALVQTSDGGYALAGYTDSFGAGNADAWLVKTDSSGNVLWNKTYGGIGNDVACALVKTNDDGLALAGYTGSFGAGGYDFWLVKTDPTGNMMWNKTYGGTGTDQATALLLTSEGGYVLAGYTRSFGAGNADAWLVKTDAGGNMQWNKTYGGTGDDWANALVQTSDGGYALAGTTTSFGAGGEGFWLVKTDSVGNMQWNKWYGGTGDEVAQALVQTSDGGYALAGWTTSFGAGDWDFWLIKTDAVGNAQWNRTYGGTARDFASALVQTSDGGYALAGYTASFGAGNLDVWLVKTDVESGLAWTDSPANTITLYRDATDPWWNFVRVRIWQVRNP